jgi:hypothetical protein
MKKKYNRNVLFSKAAGVVQLLDRTDIDEVGDVTPSGILFYRQNQLRTHLPITFFPEIFGRVTNEVREADESEHCVVAFVRVGEAEACSYRKNGGDAIIEAFIMCVSQLYPELKRPYEFSRQTKIGGGWCVLGRFTDTDECWIGNSDEADEIRGALLAVKNAMDGLLQKSKSRRQ